MSAEVADAIHDGSAMAVVLVVALLFLAVVVSTPKRRR